MSLVKQVFVCSSPRSGSTFLDMVLGGHSQIASLGEFSFLGKVISLNETCGCGEPISSCEHWSRVFERVKAEKGVDLLKDPYGLWQWDTRAVQAIDSNQQTSAYLRAASLRAVWLAVREEFGSSIRSLLPLPSSLKQGLANTLYLYDVIHEQWDEQILVDSSKNLFKALEVYRARPESSKIIFLTRDGRGVLNSRRNSGVSAKKAVNAWVKYNSRALKLLQRHVPEKDWTLVTYEAMASDTEKTLDSLCQFLGVAPEPQMLQLELGLRHVVNGNQGTKQNQKFGIRLDESWRTNLSAQDREYFEKVAGDLSTQLGYPN